MNAFLSFLLFAVWGGAWYGIARLAKSKGVRPWISHSAAALFGLIVSLVVVAIFLPAEETTQTAVVSREKNMAAPAPVSLDQKRSAFLKFEKELNEYIAQSEEIVAKVNRLLQHGESDVQLYGAFKNAHDWHKWVFMKTLEVAVPRELKADFEEKLDKARDAVQTAVMLRADAYGAAMKYLDDPKPSLLHEMKDKIERSTKYLAASGKEMWDVSDALATPPLSASR